MCVAIYKPADVRTPTLETLKKCWEANPDGAGFAMQTGGEKYAIEIKKGFMNWENFVRAFEKFRLADFRGELFIHFRIATHGGISSGNTHPFSITQDVKLLQHTNVLTNYALIHNGILPIEPDNVKISDTMELCRRLAKGAFYQNIPAAFNLLLGFVGNNKIAVMTRDKVHLLGNWENLDGVYFSNLSWSLRSYWDFYDDELRFIETKEDLRCLTKGYCPDCDNEVIKECDMYYCSGCGGIWSKSK